MSGGEGPSARPFFLDVPRFPPPPQLEAGWWVVGSQARHFFSSPEVSPPNWKPVGGWWGPRPAIGSKVVAGGVPGPPFF